MASKNSLGFGRGRDGKVSAPQLPSRGKGRGVSGYQGSSRVSGFRSRGNSATAHQSRGSSYDGRIFHNGNAATSAQKLGWFCLTVGKPSRLGPREAEFCTKLAAKGSTIGQYMLQNPLTNRHIGSSDEAVAEINSVLLNPKTRHVTACMIIITTQTDRGGLQKSFNAFLGKVRFFLLDEAEVNKCLNEPNAMTSVAREFCDSVFANNQNPQRQLSSVKPKTSSASSLQSSLAVSDWYCISIGGNDLKLLKDFTSHFSCVVRAKSFDLKDVLEYKCVPNTNDAVRILSDLLQNSNKQTAASCMVFATGNLKQLKSDLLQALGQRLRFCVFPENQLRQWYHDDASLDRLVRDFTTSCRIQRKSNESTNIFETIMSDEATDALPSKKPLGEYKIADLCNRIDNKTLLPSSSELIQKLTVDGSFYKRIQVSANTDTSPRMFQMIFKLVAAVCKFNSSEFRQNVNELLQQFIDSPDFLRKATDKCIYTLEDHDFASLPQTQLQHLQTATKDHLSVLWLLLDRFPSSHSAVSGSVSSALVILKEDSVKASPLFDEELNELLERLEMQWKFARTRIKQPEKPAVTKAINDEQQTPPQDFRQISVCPTKNDILNAPKPFIRSNITKGAYSDSEHYLDVQFRLLREDFIGPLRDGIKKFLKGETRRIGLYIYKQVQVKPPTTDKKTGILMHLATFDPMRNVQWMKRLKYGSLVCLSSDNFQMDVIFATVGDSAVESLQKGQVFLNFEFLGIRGSSELSHKAVYTMLESNVYFPAYQHVLSGLQAIPKYHGVPFAKYLVSCIPDVAKPRYLDRQSALVLFTSLTGKRSVVTNICDLEQWPSKEELRLDQSQLNALQLALTSELAIIQGPPGTGKTFLGHQLVRLLLANEYLWNPRNKNPILVVCYTNHALDQFLEGITKFAHTSDIVRIGGQSKSKKIEGCRLYYHRVRQRRSNSIPEDLQYEIEAVRKKRFHLENRINCIATIFKNLQCGLLLELDGLQSAMNEEHRKQLSKNRFAVDSTLLLWLTTSATVHATDNNNQCINVPLVRQLTEEFGFPEMAAKKALSVTGNDNLTSAYEYLIANSANLEIISNDNGTARWPAVADIDAMMMLGFSEMVAITALEIYGSVNQASAALKRAHDFEQESDRQDTAANNDAAASEQVVDDDQGVYEDRQDDEDDFQLDEDFYSS